MVLPLATFPGKDNLVNKPAAGPLRLLFWESTVGCNLSCVHCRRLEVSQALSKFDLTTEQAKAMIASLPETGKPILVFSGGEPLMRPDVYELARYAKAHGLPTALATNGTMIDYNVATKIVGAGFERVSISFDGPDAETHDAFRGDGAFEQSVLGFRALSAAGMSMQINTTVARHNFHKLDETYKLALDLGADALHIFMLVPVGCGMELSNDVLLSADEYEQALNWIYYRSVERKIHLKATCAPHYFRIIRQRSKDEHQAMPKVHGKGHPGDAMSAMSKGCLAGQAVCFVSHTGEVFPCGYLPVSSGNVKKTPLPVIWRESRVFADLRDEANLKGKCGRCEYSKVCMGCRARAFSATGSYLAEEPNCPHVPTRKAKEVSSH